MDQRDGTGPDVAGTHQMRQQSPLAGTRAMTSPKWVRCALALVIVFVVSTEANSQDRAAAFAGFAYSGDAASIAQRFPYTAQYVSGLERRGTRIYSRIADTVTASPPPNFSFELGQIDSLKGRDQAIVTALVITSETMSLERFGDLTKALALVRAQALFFDFKSQTIVRAYPLSFGSIKVFNGEPSEAEKLELVGLVFDGQDGKPGILQRYAEALRRATLPTAATRTLQVADISLGPTVVAGLPPALTQSESVRESWAADIVAEALSSRTGVPILPFARGYAIANVMAIRFADGEVFNIIIPKPDYEVRVDIKELKKVLYGQVPAGASYVYGAFADVQIVEPLMDQSYFNASLKNGEVKSVPSTQTYVDDFPAYYDAINQLFVKLALSIAGQDREWIRHATATPEMGKQLDATKELFLKCN